MVKFCLSVISSIVTQVIVSGKAAIGKNGKNLGSNIRELLNIEIKSLMSCQNIRVITTSRKMDMAYFQGMTTNIELTGVTEEGIEEYLKAKKFSEININSIKSSHTLMDCLRIPLFLCMYAMSGTNKEFGPVSRGEILYRFFNSADSVYNDRLTVERMNPLSSLGKKQMLFILDFVLPHVAQMMESAEQLSISKFEILQIIEKFLKNNDDDLLFWDSRIGAFDEYESEERNLAFIKELILQRGANEVLSVIVNNLAIMYRQETGQYYDGYSYAFIHHHIRDYFAAIYEIQKMRMALAYRDMYSRNHNAEAIDLAFGILSEINNNIWSEIKLIFIGEILCEHRNAPVINRETGEWGLPIATFPEQMILRSTLDIFRIAKKRVFYGVYNIIEAMKRVRVNLAGEDFSGLDLCQCRFHGIMCSIGRGEKRLSASFRGSAIADETFALEGGCGKVVEFVYSPEGRSLFTISEDGIAKHWDVETGKCINTGAIADWDSAYGRTSNNYFVMSPLEDVFLTYSYSQTDSGFFIQECDFSGNRLAKYTANKKSDFIHSIRYSSDASHIIGIYNLKHQGDFLCLYEQGKEKSVYEFKSNKSIMIATALMSSADEIILLNCTREDIVIINDVEEFEKTEIRCHLDLLNIHSGEMQTLHSFNTIVNLNNQPHDNPVVLLQGTPFFCVNISGDRISFFDKNHIYQYRLDTKEITSIAHKLKGAPSHMSYMGSEENLIVVVYDKIACIFDLQMQCDYLPYQLDDYGFYVNGTFGPNKLLVFDEDHDCYEWDMKKDTMHLKYKHYEMGIDSIYTSKEETEVIAMFDDGSTIFIDVETGGLNDSVCLDERGAKMGMFVFDRDKYAMVALLEYDSYEFIKYYDALSCEQKRTYYDFLDKQRINGIESSANMEYILCAFNKKASEIDMNTLVIKDIYTAQNGETIVSADYCENDIIRVVICTKPKIRNACYGEPYIIEFRRGGFGKYIKSAYYQPPTVPIDFLESFIPGQYNTHGIQGDEISELPMSTGVLIEDSSTLSMSTGIFLEHSDGLNAILTIDKHIWGDSGSERIVKHTFRAGEFFYLCYDYHWPNWGRTLFHISKDRTFAAVVIDMRLSLLRLSGGGYVEIGGITIEDRPIWACAAENENVCFIATEGNFISYINIKTGTERMYPSYVPGLAVIGCDFRCAEMSESTKKKLSSHGGVV